MGRGSAPQGGPGNYGGSKSGKPRKPRNAAKSFKVKSAPTEELEEATEEATPAFTVTRPSREHRADLLRAIRADEVAAAELATRARALARRPVNGTSLGGEVLGGCSTQELAPSVESLREARLQHLAKQQGDNHVGRAPLQLGSRASSSSNCAIDIESSPVLLSEQERRQALEALLRQPNVDSWRQSRALADSVEDESDVDIKDDELQVLIVLLLDTLADRLGLADVTKGVRLIQTVLGNVTKGDPKYLRLKAGNPKLWAGLVQHPELCMVLEAAGFRKGTAEEDRCIELGQLESSVLDLLNSTDDIDEARVEVLLNRMDELKRASISSTRSGEVGNGSNDILVGRAATFLHPADEMSLAYLAVVLDAVAKWTSLHVPRSSVMPSPSNEAAEFSTSTQK